MERVHNKSKSTTIVERIDKFIHQKAELTGRSVGKIFQEFKKQVEEVKMQVNTVRDKMPQPSKNPKKDSGHSR